MTEMLRVQSYFVAILHFLQTQYWGHSELQKIR
jgi:hypothetical protein